MRVRLDLLLDCPADAAWEALHSPVVFREVSGPITTAESLEPEGFPDRWPGGEHRVRLRMLGVLPMGTQVIRLRDETLLDGTRVVHDEGGPLSGAMTVVTGWHHRMAISPNPLSPETRTRFHDTLDVRAGVLTPFAWLGFVVFWRLRGRRIATLAPGWASQFGQASAQGGGA